MTLAVQGSTNSSITLAFLQAIIESLPTGVVVLDRDLRYLFVNQLTATMDGVAAESHLGQRASDVIPDVFPLLEPAFHEVFRTGTRSMSTQFEGVMSSHPGEIRHWTVNYYPLFDDETVVAVCAIFADTTEQVLVKKTYDHTLLELETILDIVPVGLAIAHNRECSDVSMNGVFKQMLHLPPDAGRKDWQTAVGRKGRLLDGKEAEASEMPLRKAAASGEPTNTARIDSFWPDGQRTLLAKAAPLVIDGAVTGAVAAYVDVTDLFSAQDELRAANKVKDNFLAMVSHELRTPLTMILGYAQLLTRGPDAFPDTERAALVDETYRQAVSLSHIVENLLLMTRVDHGERLETEPILVHHICRRVTQDFMSAGVEKFRLSFPKDPCVVVGNATSVEQLIRNLVSNAVKYGPVDAPIDMILEDLGAEVLLKIADTGPGIDLADRELVFEPFFRAKTSARRSGMGIGLSVCKRLVESMGGKIWADQREGGGAVFCFTLPKVPTELE